MAPPPVSQPIRWQRFSARPPAVSAPLDFGSARIRLPAATPGAAIGLMGGSFNPAHAGHRQVALAALRRLQLAQVWWLVTPENPLKAGRDLPPLAARMAAAAELAGDPRIRVCGFERELPTTYTAAAIGFLARRAPATRFVWLMGGDCLAQFHRWWSWRSILETLPVAVVDRPGFRLKAMASPAAQAYRRAYVPEDCAALLARLEPPAWTFLTVPLSPLSSTALRAMRSTVSRGRVDPPAEPTEVRH